MKRLLVLAMAVGMFAWSGLRADDNGGDSTLLQGRWTVAHRYYTPSDTTKDVAKQLTDLGGEVEIADGKLKASDPEKGGYHFVITLHPSTTPKGIDLKVPNEDKTLLAIYSVEDNVLTIDVATGSSRPTEFRDPEKQVMLVLRRVGASGGDCGENP